MDNKALNERILFGLRVKQKRRDLKMSFADLSDASGLSISYLNEIEKGKKFPKPNKLAALAKALQSKVEDLTTKELDQSLSAVGELLRSNFLNELPLDFFGIEIAKIAEIIATAPTKVSAFIATLLEISRNYALKEENFYFSALRSYLQLNYNYFPELEEAVEEFSRKYDLPKDRPIPVDILASILSESYGYKLIRNGLSTYEDLKELRSLYLPLSNHLLLGKDLTPMQEAFQLGKELAFNFLDLKERALTSSLIKGRSFTEVHNHSQAIYFSVALHLPLKDLTEKLRGFFNQKKWEPAHFDKIRNAYQATPQMFYHRLTNILPTFFGIKKMFFLRFRQDSRTNRFHIDRELHLDARHHPHGSALSEHYCRRWIAISMLENLVKEAKPSTTQVHSQRSHFWGTDDEYLCFTIARQGYPSKDNNVSVTLGLLINDHLKNTVQFWNDKSIPRKVVNKTCERCPITDCMERVAPATIVQKREKLKRIQNSIDELVTTFSSK